MIKPSQLQVGDRYLITNRTFLGHGWVGETVVFCAHDQYCEEGLKYGFRNERHADSALIYWVGDSDLAFLERVDGEMSDQVVDFLQDTE